MTSDSCEEFRHTGGNCASFIWNWLKYPKHVPKREAVGINGTYKKSELGGRAKAVNVLNGAALESVYFSTIGHMLL